MTNFRIIFFKFYFEANFPLKKKKKDLVAKYNKFTAVKSTVGSLPLSQTGIKIQDK